MNRFKQAKFFSSGSIMLIFCYLLLLFLSGALLYTIFPGFITAHIIYLPILTAFLGIGYASYNFGQDDVYPWKNGAKIFSTICIAVFLILLSTILFIVQADALILPIEVSAILFLIISYSLIAYAFALIKAELDELYVKEIVVKEPNYRLVFGHSLYAITYLMLLLGLLTTPFDYSNIFNLLGVIAAILGFLANAIGFVNFNVLFRVYPFIIEEILEKKQKEDEAKEQPQKKKSKKRKSKRSYNN